MGKERDFERDRERKKERNDGGVVMRVRKRDKKRKK